MAIKSGDKFVSMINADGKVVPFKVTPATKTGQMFVPVATADGKVVPAQVKQTSKTGERSFPVALADGRVVLVKEAGGLGSIIVPFDAAGGQFAGGLPTDGYGTRTEAGDWAVYPVEGSAPWCASTIGAGLQLGAVIEFGGEIYGIGTGNGDVWHDYPSGTTTYRRRFVRRIDEYPYWEEAHALSNNWAQQSQTLLNLIEYDGDLYLAGIGHSTLGTYDRVLKFDGANLTSTGFGNFTSIADMCIWNGCLVVVGSFTGAAGVGANRIAYWDGSWHAFASQPNATVSACCEFNGDLYIGGTFTAVGATAANRIAKWDGAAWSQVGGGISVTPGTPSISNMRSTSVGVTFTGQFDHIDATGANIPCRFLGRWDGTQYQAIVTTGETSYSSSQLTFITSYLSVIDDEIWVGHNLAASTFPYVLNGLVSDKGLFIVDSNRNLRKWGGGGSVPGRSKYVKDSAGTIHACAPDLFANEVMGDGIVNLYGTGLAKYNLDDRAWFQVTDARPASITGSTTAKYSFAFQLRNGEGGLDLYACCSGSVTIGGVTKTSAILRLNTTVDPPAWEFASASYPRATFNDSNCGGVMYNMELDDPYEEIIFATPCLNDATDVGRLCLFDGTSFSEFHNWPTFRGGTNKGAVCTGLDWDPVNERWWVATYVTGPVTWENDYCFVDYWTKGGSTWTKRPWIVWSGIAGHEQYQYSEAYYDSTPSVQRDHWIRPGMRVHVVGDKVVAGRYGNDYCYRDGDCFMIDAASPASDWQRVFFSLPDYPAWLHPSRAQIDGTVNLQAKVGDAGVIMRIGAYSGTVYDTYENYQHFGFWDLVVNGTGRSVYEQVTEVGYRSTFNLSHMRALPIVMTSGPNVSYKGGFICLPVPLRHSVSDNVNAPLSQFCNMGQVWWDVDAFVVGTEPAARDDAGVPVGYTNTCFSWTYLEE